MPNDARPPVAAIRAVTVALPVTVRSSQWWCDHHPIALEQAQTCACIADGPQADVFQGVVQRRVVDGDEDALHLAALALGDLLAAARLTGADLDHTVVFGLDGERCRVLAARVGLGAAHAGGESGESAVLAGIADAAERARRGQRVAVIAACDHTRGADPAECLTHGDAAAAVLVAPAAGRGAIRSTWDVPDPTPGAVAVAVREALARAGVCREDVAALIVSGPTVGYAELWPVWLGMDRDRVVDVRPSIGACGPALVLANLAAAAPGLAVGDPVVLCAQDGGATRVVVLEWGPD